MLDLTVQSALQEKKMSMIPDGYVFHPIAS